MKTLIVLFLMCASSWLMADSLDDQITADEQQINHLDSQWFRLSDQIIDAITHDDHNKEMALRSQQNDVKEQQGSLEIEVRNLKDQKFQNQMKQQDRDSQAQIEKTNKDMQQELDQAAERTTALMKSWVGNTKAHLLEKWGPPSSKFLEGDTEIWTYTNPEQTITRQFYFNKKGIIYNWRWQGL